MQKNTIKLMLLPIAILFSVIAIGLFCIGRVEAVEDPALDSPDLTNESESRAKPVAETKVPEKKVSVEPVQIDNGNVEDGTADGQMLYWNTGDGEYKHSDENNFAYDAENNILTLNRGDGNILVGPGVTGAGMMQIPYADHNVVVGEEAGYSLTLGDDNIFVGRHAGYSNAHANRNIFLGLNAGKSTTIGGSNIFIGGVSGINNTVGVRNIFVGDFAANRNTSGHSNVAIGESASTYNQTGQDNTAVGRKALFGTVENSHSHNAALGSYAGYSITTGDASVFLGSHAGYYETGSNKLFIDNAQRADEADGREKALMYGVFDADTANQELNVNGYLITKEAIKGLERNSDPSRPEEGEFVIWMSDGTEKGDDGDIMIGSTVDGTSKYGILFDHSAGSDW
jgi:hypothetical protein